MNRTTNVLRRREATQRRLACLGASRYARRVRERNADLAMSDVEYVPDTSQWRVDPIKYAHQEYARYHETRVSPSRPWWKRLLGL